MLITEQLPNLVREQVNAISNLKIDKGTVWDSSKKGDDKSTTADFLSGMIKVLPPLHELARNAGLELPAHLGELQREAQRQQGAVKPPPPRADEGEARGKGPPAQSKPPAAYLSLALTASRVILTPMKLKVLLFLTCVFLLQSGCALPPTIDEQSREETRQQQVEKRSDAFAKTLAQ
ncbi:MAG TPA: hypothetical protein VH207_00560 [Chthoniobacterales bacterium]|jgi:hypothetical protein|nr:hypothetical protein [Chthoniobacterales bacterium]